MNEQEHTMTGAWAVNALDAEERERMRRRLAEDPEAAAEARSFEETAAELAGSLPPLAPRPALKAAVMARIGTTRQLSPLPEEETGDEVSPSAAPPSAAPSAAPSLAPANAPSAASSADPANAPSGAPSADGTAPPPGRPAEVVSLDRYRASVRRSRWTAVAAAALMVTTIVGAGLWSGVRADEQEARASLEAMASEQAVAEQESAMLSTILAAGDAAHQEIPAEGGGSLQLMYSREQQAMIVQGAGLPALPEGEVYQLWMIEGSSIASAGMLEDPAAPMMHDGAIPEGATLGLTIEPAGGSEQPTTEPIAAGVLS